MKVPRTGGWSGLVLAGIWLATAVTYGQNQDVNQNPMPQGRDVMTIPMHPGGGPDPYAKYEKDFTGGDSSRDQDRLISLIRQKQLTQATDLLLKLTHDLRAELAEKQSGTLTEDEMQRLKLIEKLAHLIQDREKAEDQVSAALAKSGKGP
jgi:hypothetical protein